MAVIGEYLYKIAVIEGRNRIIDEEFQEIFREALADLNPKEIERGMKAYLKEGTRFPWPSEIRELSEL